MTRRSRREERRRQLPVRTADRVSYYRSGEFYTTDSNPLVAPTARRRPPVFLPDDDLVQRTITSLLDVERQGPINERAYRATKGSVWSSTPISRRKAVWRDLARPRPMFAAQLKYCVQRAARRQVLFAMRVAGRKRSAPGRGGKYRRSITSYYRC